MKHVFFLVLLCLLHTGRTCAQGVIWELEPRDCSSLASIGHKMYSISEGGACGVIDSRGNVIVPPEHSQITPFHEGVALVLNGDRIDGALTAAGAYRQFQTPYYTLDGQVFYSDGYITVRNQRGEKGFIDVEGNPLGFNKGFTRIQPFVEGYAAVYRGVQFMLVDKTLTPLPITIGIGVVTSGTNFYQGTAVVWDGKGDGYLVTPKQTVRKKEYDYSRLQDPRLDYLSRLVSITGQPEIVPYDADSRGVPQYLPYQGGDGRFGYKGLVLPQFSSAEPVYDNLAVVKRMGQWGIIRVNPRDAPFMLQSDKTSYVYRDGEQVRCQLYLTSVPSAWIDKDVSVRLVEKETQNTVGYGTFKDGKYEFNVNPMAPSSTFVYHITGGGLLLGQGELTCIFEKVLDLKADIQVLNTKANDKDRCLVRVTVRNPNSIPITASISVSGSGPLSAVSQRKTLAANASAELTTSFYVPKSALYNQLVLVKMDGKVIAEKTIKELKPFYEGM